MTQESMVPKRMSPRLGPLAQALDVVEQPADLRAGEVGRQRQAGLAAEAVLAAVAAELPAQRVGAGVLPDDARCAPARRCVRSHSTVVSRWLVMPMALTSSRR